MSLTITGNVIPPNVITTLTVTATANAAHTCRLWAAGTDNNGAATNRQGAEMASEGWLKCRLAGDTEWFTLTFPTSFPDQFADLGAAQGVFVFTMTTPKDIEVLLTIPEDCSTSGEMLAEVVLVGLPT